MRKHSLKAKTVAVVSDGSAVPELGNIGGALSLPVIEGRAALLKELTGIDAVPICLGTQDAGEIAQTVKHIAPTFGGILLDYIAAPTCFEACARLRGALDIPVFHDGQHGAAIVAAAAVVNSYRVLGKGLSDVSAVICGAGTAGNAIAKMLNGLGMKDVIVCDSKGILSASRIHEFGEAKLELLEFTNREGLSGGLARAIKGRDLFIGVSAPNVLTEKLIATMAKDPVVFAMASPEPEIFPGLAREAGARIVGSGRADLPNCISTTLAFPGVIKGALDAGASEITDAMRTAAVYALAGLVPAGELGDGCVLPQVSTEGVAAAIADAVAEAWK